MNPVYSPGSSGVPYANAKGIGYPAGFPMGYAAAAPAYSPNMYPGANPTFQAGYTPGTPYKVSCSPTSGAVPPYSSSPSPYQAAVFPVRSAYPQQSAYAQVGLGAPWASRGGSWALGAGRLLGAPSQRAGPCCICVSSFPSKAHTTPSPCMQHRRMSSTTPRWCSPTACRPRCTLLPSLRREATGSPWAWWRAPLWPCRRVCGWSCAVTSWRFHSWCCRPSASNQDFLRNALDT
uniref:Family with sequence similarity 168 member B n=1 Tax=Moschus moschiferus TaxID=68415 RepID=A0A8C6FMY1_MOSMO